MREAGGRADHLGSGLRAASSGTPIDAQFRRLVASADALQEQGQTDQAESLLRLALRVQPGSALAQNAMGSVLFDAGRLDEALACFRLAIAIDDGAAGAWGNAGLVLKTLGRFGEAIAAYDQALALDPRSSQLRLNRAIALLRAGRMAEAWGDYECRLSLPGSGPAVERLLPVLDGGVDLRGRTVLVMHEEGFGDTLQFVRYVPLLAARGARVVVVAPRVLAGLLSRVAEVAEVVEAGSALPAYDYACPFFSLPRAFATTLQTIPAAVPYLHAEPELVRRWGAVLPWRHARRLRVGLVWAGQARPWLPGFAALDSRRSAGLAVFAPLGGVAAEFVSLQVGVPEPPPPGLAMHDPMSGVRDFSDTAAIIAHLDVVVSVDTSVVHLAGGMGKTVLLLDRYDACWRWFSDRTDSPWYPGLRIFRQERPGSWEAPMRGIAAALEEMAGTKRRGRHAIAATGAAG